MGKRDLGGQRRVGTMWARISGQTLGFEKKGRGIARGGREGCLAMGDQGHPMMTKLGNKETHSMQGKAGATVGLGEEWKRKGDRPHS